ncbi:M48 family metallopeptidase [Kushneria aurantia]|uniref:M48 family metallopeptidase n=1 Tax=Kushneria aurantia TaxID=504092 RepID=A0ABV6G4X7_9GAMM|nr:M48 family metallopeptidase [Kushneria aurantia]
MNFSLVYPGERRRFVLLMVIASILWISLSLVSLGLILIYLLLVGLVVFFAHSAFIAMIRGNGVKISAEQYPELAADIEACCWTLGIETPPQVYLLHADGLFNALATRFLRRHYVVLFSSVVDALAERPEALRFYIGHELGHIQRKHLALGPILAIAGWLPLLGAAYQRACEYTCDRYGLACCQDPDAAFAAVSALAAGESRWKTLNLSAYAAQRHDLKGFWTSLHELIGDYPWSTKRAHAILRLAEGEEPAQPRRHPLAWCFAAFFPRIPGFGGADVMVYLMIIGLSIAIGWDEFQAYQSRTQLANFVAQTDSDQAAVTAFALREKVWPETLDQLGIGMLRSTDDLHANIQLGIEGELRYTFVGYSHAGQSLTMTPYPVFDEQNILVGFDWSCWSEDLKTVLPDGCQRMAP